MSLKRKDVGGRWGKNRSQDTGFRIQEVKEQVYGGRSQESGVRMKSICFPPSAFCLLLTADCLLNLKGLRVGGTLGPYGSLGQDVTAHRERKN